jgi:alcohol oxidase
LNSTRASASDYDDFQAKGWTTKELIPLMRKHETYQRACNNREVHGFDGPIKVSFGNYTYPIMQDFLRAAESQGFPVTDDLQDLVTGYVYPFQVVTVMFVNRFVQTWCRALAQVDQP